MDIIQNKGKQQTYSINHASILKRFMAFIIDSILLVVAISGFMLLFNKIFNYDYEYEKLQQKYVEHGVITTDINGNYITCNTELNDDGTINIEGACYKAKVAFKNDNEAMKQSDKCDSLMVVILSCSTLASLLLLEFVIPWHS